MRAAAAIVSAITVVAGLAGATAKAAVCDPLGNIQFICGVASPEDLAVVPRSDWMIASGNKAGQGALRAVNLRSKTVTTLFPSAAVKARPNAKAYPTCPGPLDDGNAAEQSMFAAHGLYLKPGRKAVHTLYVVHHGTRESVEVFELDASVAPPALTWIGCVVGPPGARMNAVVALPDGGIGATNTPGQVPVGAAPTERQMGAVWEWHAATGWKVLPGSEGSRINGLEISRDGKWLYASAWGDQTIIRLRRGAPAVKPDVRPTPFRIDNLRQMADGSIFVAGHSGTALCSCPTETWHIGMLDPKALTVTELLKRSFADGFGAATVAVKAGREIWIGAQRGDRIGRFPAP
jgi:hypothetical protein